MKFINLLLCLFVLSCNIKNDDSTESKPLKVKQVGFLEPFKYTLRQYTTESNGYIVPYLYVIENVTDSSIYEVDIQTIFEISKKHNMSKINNLTLSIQNSCKILDTTINGSTYDDFNPLLPKKSFMCVGYLKFLENGNDFNIGLDDGNLLKYLKSNVPIETNFLIKSTVKMNYPNEVDIHGIPKSEYIFYDTSSFMKDLLSINDIKHKKFNDNFLDRKEFPDKIIWDYIYTLLKKDTIDFVIGKNY